MPTGSGFELGAEAREDAPKSCDQEVVVSEYRLSEDRRGLGNCREDISVGSVEEIHRASQGQEKDTTISQLKTELAEQQKNTKALTAGLQKVSAQLKLGRSAPQTVKNNN